MKRISQLLLAITLTLFATSCDKNNDNPNPVNPDNPGSGERVTGYFSVSENHQVIFAPGNLQWCATGSHFTALDTSGVSTGVGKWRFAANQWDMIGEDNDKVSPSYSGWIDFFPWGTSGYGSKQPYDTDDEDPTYGNGPTDIVETLYDWGTYNEIYNPLTGKTDPPGTWRTMNYYNEWKYLLEERDNARKKYGYGSINGTYGMILLPDNWTLPSGSTFYSSTDHKTNTYTAEQWKSLENAGAIFLPAAGYRKWQEIKEVNTDCKYWTGEYDGINFADCIYHNADPGSGMGGYNAYRAEGLTVRLVKDR